MGMILLHKHGRRAVVILGLVILATLILWTATVSADMVSLPRETLSNTVSYITVPPGASHPQYVAVAPDNTDIVAIVADNKEVYVSTDGGIKWYSLGVPQEAGGAAAANLYDIAVSPTATQGVNYIAVAGVETGSLANIWYFPLGTVTPVWKETNDLAGFATTTSDRAVSLMFSPNFAADYVMLAITEEDDAGAGNDYIRLEAFSLNSNKWNIDPGYPVAIVKDVGITGLYSASIALGPEYIGGEEETRITFVGLTIAGDISAVAKSGIYRLDDYLVTALMTGKKINSVSFDGTNLVAGAYDTNDVWYNTNPLASLPNFLLSTDGPGGQNRVILAQAPGISKVMAGTSGSGSAFSMSTDNGKTFKEISFAAAGTDVSDFAVGANGTTVYVIDGESNKICKSTNGGFTWECTFTPESLDFGDAPDPLYPTLLKNNGARHTIDGLTYLGTKPDEEPDGQPGVNADGDDNNNIDDEDGVIFNSPLVLYQQAEVSVMASRTGSLHAWIDFNADGDWADWNERIFFNRVLAPGSNILQFHVPGVAKVGQTYARFRFSTQTDLSFDGLAPDGEVEDYRVEIKYSQRPPLTSEIVWDVKLPPDLKARIYEIAIVPGTSRIIAISPEAIWQVDESGEFKPVIRLSTGKEIAESATLAASASRAGIFIHDRHIISGFKLIDLRGKVIAAVENPLNFHYRIAPMGDSFVGIGAAGEHAPLTADQFIYTFFGETGKVNGKVPSRRPQPMDSAYTADGNAFVVSNDGGLFAYNIKDASLRWKIPRPVRFFAAAATPTGLVAVSDDDNRNVVSAYRAGERRWDFKLERNVRNLAISANGEFMLATDRNTAHLLGPGQSSPRWSFTMPEKGVAINSAAVNDRGIVALGGQRPGLNGGLVFILDPYGNQMFYKEFKWGLSNAWVPGVQFSLDQTSVQIRTLEELVLVSTG